MEDGRPMCTREWRQPTAVDGGSKDRNRTESERKKGTGRSEIGKRGDRQTAPSSIIADDDSKCGPASVSVG